MYPWKEEKDPWKLAKDERKLQNVSRRRESFLWKVEKLSALIFQSITIATLATKSFFQKNAENQISNLSQEFLSFLWIDVFAMEFFSPFPRQTFPFPPLFGNFNLSILIFREHFSLPRRAWCSTFLSESAPERNLINYSILLRE